MKKTAFENIIDSITSGESFILEAGAGSGKTYTLIQTLNHIIEKHSDQLKIKGQKIGCITFTNVAKNEILERTEHNPLIEVLTIHEFLWSCIANYQSELHLKLEELNKEYERQRVEEKRREGYEYVNDLLNVTQHKRIQYSEYGRKFSEGVITHEDIILISYFMFKSYPVLSEIIADQYPFIFVDEYQDTEETTVAVLLDYVLKAKKKCIIGFFGDSMQKIYDDGVGRINKKYHDEQSKDKCLRFITKEENYRCSKAVIALLNKIRTNIQQTSGPHNKEGSAYFLSAKNIDSAIKYLEEKCAWNFNSKETKILFLTHTGIAGKLGYQSLLKILNTRYGQYGRDRFFNKDERYSKFLIGENGVEVLIEHYKEERYGEIIDQLRKVGYSIDNHKSKEIIKEKIESVDTIRTTKTVGDVIKYVKENNLLPISDKIKEFENYISQPSFPEDEKEKAEKDKTYYNSLMLLKYSEIISAFNFVEEKTIFSTKHGTKGAEYENVLVVIDGAWPQKYNFKEVFENQSKYPDRLERSLNLFYVSCSRAKNNLAVLSVTDMPTKAMETIGEWFDTKNIVTIN